MYIYTMQQILWQNRSGLRKFSVIDNILPYVKQAKYIYNWATHTFDFYASNLKYYSLEQNL